MPDIVLSAEQVGLLNGADRARVVGPNGDVLGHIDRSSLTANEVAEIKRRARECRVWYSGDQVQQHFQALHRALEEEGSMDESRAREILAEARARQAS